MNANVDPVTNAERDAILVNAPEVPTTTIELAEITGDDVNTLYATIPPRMQEAQRWLLWRLENETRKVPYYVNFTKRHGKLDGPGDQTNLATLEQALEALKQRPEFNLGFALGPDGTGNCWQGIDLDHADQHPGHADLLARLPGYRETSPSGTGYHAIGYGPHFSALGSNDSGIEAYASARYFTFTGQAIGGDIEDLAPFVVGTLAPLHREGTKAKVADPSDENVFPLTPIQVADLRSALNSIDPDDRATWVAMGEALSGQGEVGRGLWLDWSQMSPKWQPQDALEWETFRGNYTGYAAVFAEAQRRGWVNPASKSKPDLDAALLKAEEVISLCQEQPNLLASPAFLEACKLIRAEDPENWVGLRVKLKQAKPSGALLSDIDDATRPDTEEAEDRSSVADELVALVQAQAVLFHKEDGACFVTLKEPPCKTYRLDSRLFQEWLGYAYFQDTRATRGNGSAVSEQALRSARNVLTGIATHEGEEREAFLRSAKVGDRYYLDLGSDDWSVIEIQASGWRHLLKSPVTFWRSATARPLPHPVPGGNLDRLWDYVNIPAELRSLVLAWMLETWRPETPFPVLELVGSHGTAKSSTQAWLRHFLDPNAVNLRSVPKSVEDLFVSAGANWLASFNNLSHLSAGMQDALCNLATGGGFASRTLYTNGDETLIEAKRPVILNGIVPIVTAQDLSDRVIHIELPEIGTYRPESELDEAFQRDAPGILGGLLDLFVATLDHLPRVTLDRPPRMADFARLGEAMMRAMGQGPDAFKNLYATNREESATRSLESSPVAVAIMRLVEEHQDQHPGKPVVYGGDRDPRKNTMGGLLGKLYWSREQGSDAWPRSARGLGNALRRQLPALAQIGITITISKPGMYGVTVRIAVEPDF